MTYVAWLVGIRRIQSISNETVSRIYSVKKSYEKRMNDYEEHMADDRVVEEVYDTIVEGTRRRGK